MKALLNIRHDPGTGVYRLSKDEARAQGANPVSDVRLLDGTLCFERTFGGGLAHMLIKTQNNDGRWFPAVLHPTSSRTCRCIAGWAAVVMMDAEGQLSWTHVLEGAVCLVPANHAHAVYLGGATTALFEVFGPPTEVSWQSLPDMDEVVNVFGAAAVLGFSLAKKP